MSALSDAAPLLGSDSTGPLRPDVPRACRTLRGVPSALVSEIRWDGSIDGSPAARLPVAKRRNVEGLPAVFFDGDDTLWATESLYDDARRWAGEVVEGQGLPADRWWDEQIRIDVANTSKFGLRAERFPTSCVEAYVVVAGRASAPVQQSASDEIWRRGASVFSAVAPVKDGVENVLNELRDRNRLVLLTQGDPRVQSKRVTDSGLAPLFDDIIVVEKKSTGVLVKLLEEFGLASDRAWMVGNSIPSDVNPAIAAGMRVIWIEAHVWEHERRESPGQLDGVTVAHSIAEVTAVITGTDEANS